MRPLSQPDQTTEHAARVYRRNAACCRTPVFAEAHPGGALPAQLRRPQPQSAMSATRRSATFNRSPPVYIRPSALFIASTAVPRSPFGQRWPGGERLWDIQNMIRSPRSGGRGTQAESSEPKGALKAQQGWTIRFWLDRERRLRDRAMFDLAIARLVRELSTTEVAWLFRIEH